jgi:outer membrane protein assembly factor BamB
MFGTGKYEPLGTGIYVFRQGKAKQLPPTTEGTVSWLYSHDNPFYPPDQKPLLRAWNIENGKEVWSHDFSAHGAGGDDASVCLMDDTLYYSCFFGYAARSKDGTPTTKGITLAMNPATGRILWQTGKYYLTQGCAISAEKGRLYLGGYNPPNEQTEDRYVRCLDARDGSLIWQSEPLTKAINVVTVGEKFIFAYAYGGDSFVLDKGTGKILSRFNKGYACTRFTLSGPYLVGANMDILDPADGPKLLSSGPPVDSRECVGGVVSNGRLFYTSQASGLQVSQRFGAEAASPDMPWK